MFCTFISSNDLSKSVEHQILGWKRVCAVPLVPPMAMPVHPNDSKDFTSSKYRVLA